MSLSVHRNAAPAPQCLDCSTAPVAKIERPHTPAQKLAGDFVTVAYAAGSIGGVVLAGAALAAVTGLIATGVIDHSYGTHMSDVFLANVKPFETAMRVGTIFVGACAAMMVTGLGAFGVAGLAARFRRTAA